MTTGSFFWEGSQRSLALASQQRQRELCGAFHPVHLFLPHEALWMRCSRVRLLSPHNLRLNSAAQVNISYFSQPPCPFPVPLCCYLLQQRTNGNRWPASSLIKIYTGEAKTGQVLKPTAPKRALQEQPSPLPCLFFFFPLSFLLHGNRVGVKEMCKHTLVLSTSLSARLNRSHKNMFCTSRTCRRLKLSAACQQKQTLETGLGYHNPP